MLSDVNHHLHGLLALGVNERIGLPEVCEVKMLREQVTPLRQDTLPKQHGQRNAQMMIVHARGYPTLATGASHMKRRTN